MIEEKILPEYKNNRERIRVIFTSPDGTLWDNKSAHNMSLYFDASNKDVPDLVFICGRYEGIDQRFIDLYVDEVYSLGSYVLSGGELPVLSIIDSSMRFVPGVLGNKLSSKQESFENNYFDCPKWTRPLTFKGQTVPDILTSGNHMEIQKFNISKQRRVKFD